MTPTMSKYRKEAGGVDFPTFLYFFCFNRRQQEALKNKGPRELATTLAATFAASLFCLKRPELLTVSVSVECHFIGSHGRQCYNDRVYRSNKRRLYVQARCETRRGNH